MFLSFDRNLVAWAAALSLLAAPIYACGPFFPNRVLIGGDRVVLQAPVANFRREVERIKPPLPARFKAMLPPRKDAKGKHITEPHRRQTAVADVADLKKALEGLKTTAGEKAGILKEYGALRAELDRLAKSRTPASALTVPRGLPGEFADYARGALFFHQGKREDARKQWKALLKRPAKERHYRSTWAAFMLGKTEQEGDIDQAVPRYALVRKLAGSGFADSLGLAASSLGWEAQAMIHLQKYDQAMELYVAQLATGDNTAVSSLQFAAGAALKAPPEHLKQAAKGITSRRVVTAYIVSQGGPFPWNSLKASARKWLTAIEKGKVFEAREADRLAWVAYQLGDVKLAKRWLAVAPRKSTMTRWIRAKLLLHAGDLAGAAKELAQIARKFPPARRARVSNEFRSRSQWNLASDPIAERVRGELGTLLLARRQFVESLDVLLRGGYWEDAAYVAERVLILKELKTYIDRNWPAAKTEKAEEARERTHPGWIRLKLRYLLARRLTRGGRWKEARVYYPPVWRPRLDAYVAALRKGNDRRAKQQARASAFWKAACIARYQGMELLGTEVNPDWSVDGGRYKSMSTPGIRSKPGFAKLVLMSPEELRRTRQHSVNPERRFHYRYAAADHAWRAAVLMPGENDKTARVLCIAGSWLKDRDRKAADRFYKALVQWCGKTDLGKQANQLRWFPKIKVDKKKLLE